MCSNFESPFSPQFLNQEPPRAQQLSLPDFLMVPHLKHVRPVGVMVVVVAAGVDWHADIGQRNEEAGVTFKHHLHNHMSLHSVSRGLLQACTPSTHVCSNFESPLPPFLNQAPPGAQQLSFPDFLMVPHLKQMGPVGIMVVVVTAAVDMESLVRQALHSNTISTPYVLSAVGFCRPERLQSTCDQTLGLRHCHIC